MKFKIFLVLFAAIMFLIGCSSGDKSQLESQNSDEPHKIDKRQSQQIKLATTTSCDNSGLLNHILPDLLEKHQIQVDVIAVGTGKALQHGCAGDVDVVLVHAPDAEIDFIEKGCGIERYYVAQNQFMIVGAKDNPAGLKDADSLIDAFTRISDSESIFISRGDKSGTHQMELGVWEKLGVQPSGSWYIEAGQGMGAVLIMTAERNGYTLTDSGTFYSMIDKLDLEVSFEDDPMLDNIYSVISLNPEKYPDLKHDAAAVFIEWITSDETGRLIEDFQVNGFSLFEVKK